MTQTSTSSTVSQQTTRKFDAEISKVLQLMIHSLYTNKEIFLRELISNASDACVKILQQKGAIADKDDLKITVRLDVSAQTLFIEDNGIGMDEQDLVANLGIIAHSGTQRFADMHKDSSQLIGQFGVGFYSSFIVADEVTVISRKLGSDITYQWKSDGVGEYTVGVAAEERARGTTVKLHLNAKEIEFLDKHRISHLITSYSDHISFPIILVDAEGVEARVNAATALWMRNKNEITANEYEEFFHKIAHMPSSPWLTLHNQLEGVLNYTSLLYVPQHKPYDLFHPDRKCRVKLYVKRVFICEEGVDLIPNYLRFIQGIVDSEDLPLNISRETLQSNSLVAQIKKSLVKRILTALKNKAEVEPEEFKKFWQNFGEVMKEGLCEGALLEKEQLLEVCRFYSTKSDDELISLDQYIANMADTQEHIFFITGDNLQALRNSPQLEGFVKRGIEVLLLADNVDDFWINVVHQYKNKELCSISRANLDLEQIKPLATDAKPDSADNTEVINETANNSLIETIKQVLGSRILYVKISDKLIDSPACLALPEGAMSSRMERYLIDQKQLAKKTAKILEINPKHQLFVKINELSQTNSAAVQDLIEVIFAQACLVEGEALDDPYLFNKRVTGLLVANGC